MKRVEIESWALATTAAEGRGYGVVVGRKEESKEGRKERGLGGEDVRKVGLRGWVWSGGGDGRWN